MTFRDVSQIIGVSPPAYGTVSGSNKIRVLAIVDSEYEYLTLYTPGNIFPVSCFDELPGDTDYIGNNNDNTAQFTASENYQLYENFYTAYVRNYLTQNSLSDIESMDQTINITGISVNLEYPASFFNRA